ncbi:DUF1501 domain-containing protein [Aquabacterium sp.]|uniref:DUF1501 domain-containing protein n=1 Tax=Aquabacterium sp. TaxID=1872578 RepID=UPI002B8609F4|nr:DUF1501 domain-containing protein [Aquabacterium sp.]HSW03349.1 DUF1501 domain-containing protein [Aquabacterium sp.]
MQRRHFLGSAGLAGGAGLLGLLSGDGHAAADEYRALVVVFLEGGNDGHNCLVPTDAAYGDYQSARANLALSKNSLVALAGKSAGHSFGVHPTLAAMAGLYNEGRLAWIANAGPLVEPATAQQVLANAVELPPFLMSHSDQVAIQQGWTVQDDMSGWAGRGLELLPSTMRHPISAVTTNTNRTLVLGKRSPVSFLPQDGARWWGAGDLSQPQQEQVQAINRMAQWQFANAYEAEYARTLGSAVADSARFTQALMQAAPPSADFGNAYLAEQLRTVATVLPMFKSEGLKRQVFVVSEGGYDTHANQRGSGANTQDTLLAGMAKALAGFDQHMRTSGLDQNVVTLVMSDFGRTLRPGSGGGSEHAWGNHWFALGGPVAGGQVLGSFPALKLGGVDDGDPGKNGRLVPAVATDQVGATLMQWLGLAPNLLHDVFPNLVNFNQKTIPLLRA